jgi:lipopolysaccharide cholinephosphotransferase
MQDDLSGDEVRCGYKVSSEMKKIWSIELDLARKLKEVCEKYHLRFYMQAGTLLGAVRHQGFIPWDDDMDFVMPREDFDILESIAHKEFTEPYFLQTMINSEEIFNNGRAVLRNSNTTGLRGHRDLYKKGNHGIGIDINILDNIYDSPQRRKRYWEKADRLLKITTLKYYGAKVKKIGDLTISFSDRMRYYTNFDNKQILCMKLRDVFVSCTDNDSKYLNIITQANYRHHLYYREDFDKCIFLKFEDMELPAPAGYDRVLRTDFGDDYMSLPPHSHRHPRHYPVVRTDISYRVYMKHFQDIFANTAGRKIVIFGAGQMLLHYLAHTHKKFHPAFVVDNNKDKWGTYVKGFEVRNPNCILDLADDERHIIICSIYYKEIEAQLIDMGISDYYIYVQNLKWL